MGSFCRTSYNDRAIIRNEQLINKKLDKVIFNSYN
jgi:hypothetical protein